ncbi:hypothetical protein F5148DRAFT_1217855 [Russula earlei]|uniref:Uncharacterized protein n=1 Tax=Russula earlei TaxID=71964 RepID=A0ACC0U2T5_9AGAM|nr:hypothetical protein F5148DRAFT_1217855 [Russula earlei]
MSPPFHPAVQVLPLNPGPRPTDELRYSPGAGPARPNLYYDAFDNQGGLAPLTISSPVPTDSLTNAPALSTGSAPIQTTVVQVSTLIVSPEELPLPDPVLNATFPAITSSSSIVLSSSLPPPSPPPSPSPTSSTSTPLIPSPRASSPDSPNIPFGSATMPATTSPADTFLAGTTGGSGTHSGLSGGAIAAIVLLVLFVLCAASFFVVRNRRIQKRVASRVTWTTGLTPRPDSDSSLEKGVGHVHSVASDAAAAGPSQPPPAGPGDSVVGAPVPVRTIARKPPLPYSPVSPTAPPQSYNNPPVSPVSDTHSPNVPSIASVDTFGVPTTVRVRFVPQLPDELPITPGETLYIQTEFDDGWALCRNSTGEQGMVPLECLEGGGGQFAGVSRTGDRRSTRRASSLRSVATWG